MMGSLGTYFAVVVKLPSSCGAFLCIYFGPICLTVAVATYSNILQRHGQRVHTCILQCHEHVHMVSSVVNNTYIYCPV